MKKLKFIFLNVISFVFIMFAGSSGFAIGADEFIIIKENKAVKMPGRVIENQTIHRDNGICISGYNVTSVGTIDIVVDSFGSIMGLYDNKDLGDGNYGVMLSRIDENGETICKYGIIIDGAGQLRYAPLIIDRSKRETKWCYVVEGQHKIISGTYETQQELNSTLRIPTQRSVKTTQ